MGVCAFEVHHDTGGPHRCLESSPPVLQTFLSRLAFAFAALESGNTDSQRAEAFDDSSKRLHYSFILDLWSWSVQLSSGPNLPG